MDERLPETEPSGALVPPPRVPPGALATAAPLPPHRPGEHSRVSTGLLDAMRRFSATFLRDALDRLDEVGDRIAGAAGIR